MSRAHDNHASPGAARASDRRTGRVGARWHRDVDDVLLGTRPGAVDRTARTEVVR